MDVFETSTATAIRKRGTDAQARSDAAPLRTEVADRSILCSDASSPSKFFVARAVPLSVQMMMVRYWLTHGKFSAI